MDMATKDSINSALRVLGVTGLAGTTIVAPNALKGLELLLRKSPAKTSDYVRLLKELKRQGLVHISRRGDELHYSLTPAGAYRLQEIAIDEIEIPRPSRWDKRWRLIAFDIPVKQSRQRSLFVGRLQNLGFTMLQRSLWVYPFPCFDQVERLAGHYNVLRHCNLIEVSQVDKLAARKLLRHFDNLLRSQRP